MHTNLFDLSIRVLLYREDGGFVAHALEMDLAGFGRDEKHALEALHEMIEAQISFASVQNDQSMIFHAAPRELFERWERAHESHLKNEFSGERFGKVEVQAKSICFTRDEFRKAAKSRHFQPLTKSALAEA